MALATHDVRVTCVYLAAISHAHTHFSVMLFEESPAGLHTQTMDLHGSQLSATALCQGMAKRLTAFSPKSSSVQLFIHRTTTSTPATGMRAGSCAVLAVPGNAPTPFNRWAASTCWTGLSSIAHIGSQTYLQKNRSRHQTLTKCPGVGQTPVLTTLGPISQVQKVTTHATLILVVTF